MSSSSDEAAVDPDSVVDQPTAEGSDVAKKRKAKDKSKWKKTVCKKRRDSGQEYVSRSMHHVVAARHVGAPCTSPKKCFDVVGHDKVTKVALGGNIALFAHKKNRRKSNYKHIIIIFLHNIRFIIHF